MRKALVLVALAGLLLSSAAFAQETYTETLYPAPDGTNGVNWIALRGVPFDPSPVTVFGDEMRIDGLMSKLDPVTGNTNTYFSFDAESFGNLLLGDGFWVNNDSGNEYTISYQGVYDGVPSDLTNETTRAATMTDMWISLPGQTGSNGGYHWVGFPFNHPIPWVNVKVTDGTQTLPVQDAVAAGWLLDFWAYMDGPSQSTFNVDPDGIMGADVLEPGRMYQVVTYRSNLALIIPAN